jgi:hypothetical protein
MPLLDPPIATPISGASAARAMALLLALVLGLLAVAGPARAYGARGAEPRVELPSGLALRAGQSLEIRWSKPDASVDELEILLSIDGGRRFALRVSPELDARAGRYVWRVPNLSSAQARLHIRYHREGREIDGASSAPFTLIGKPGLHPTGSSAPELEPGGDRACGSLDEAAEGAARESAPVHEGTWWTGFQTLDVPGAAQALAAPGDHIFASRDLPAAGPLPATPSASRRADVARAQPAASGQPSAAPAPLAPERHYPLRN